MNEINFVMVKTKSGKIFKKDIPGGCDAVLVGEDARHIKKPAPIGEPDLEEMGDPRVEEEASTSSLMGPEAIYIPAGSIYGALGVTDVCVYKNGQWYCW